MLAHRRALRSTINIALSTINIAARRHSNDVSTHSFIAIMTKYTTSLLWVPANQLCMHHVWPLASQRLFHSTPARNCPSRTLVLYTESHPAEITPSSTSNTSKYMMIYCITAYSPFMHLYISYTMHPHLLPNTHPDPPSRLLEPRLQMSYTCNICKGRSTKEFSKQSYYHGMMPPLHAPAAADNYHM